MSRTSDGKCPDVGQWCGIERDLCDGDCMVKRIEDLEAENARLKAALKPIIDFRPDIRGDYGEYEAWDSDLMMEAMVEARRIYNGGEE